MIYFSDLHHKKVKFYNTFIRARRYYHIIVNFLNANNFKWNTSKDFRYRYIYLKRYYRHLFPWDFVTEGSTVIQVSAAKQLIVGGLSQALIASTLVGPDGKVVVVEPDPVNVSFLKTYILCNKIKNVHIVEKGIWKEQTSLKFSVLDDNSSTNTISDLLDTNRTSPFGQKSNEIDIEVDTIDNIVASHGLTNISLINATINGAEYEAVEGAQRILEKPDVAMSFPIQNIRTFRSPILKDLQSKGFHILIRHAPVSLYQRQFLVACAVRRSNHTIQNQGYFPVYLDEVVKDGKKMILVKSIDGSIVYDHCNFNDQVVINFNPLKKERAFQDSSKN